MASTAVAELLRLPIEERLRMVQRLWDSVPEDRNPYPLSAAECAELDRRLDRYRREPQRLTSPEEVVRRIRSSR